MLRMANRVVFTHRGEYACADRRVIEATFVTDSVWSI